MRAPHLLRDIWRKLSRISLRRRSQGRGVVPAYDEGKRLLLGLRDDLEGGLD